MHELPRDLRQALASNTVALEAWKDITPLARNEFICWVEDAKREATRERRIRECYSSTSCVIRPKRPFRSRKMRFRFIALSRRESLPLPPTTARMASRRAFLRPCGS